MMMFPLIREKETMKIYIEFTFTYAEENVSWEIKKKVAQILYKLKNIVQESDGFLILYID